MSSKKKTCFIVSSIGPDDSDIRKKANEKLKYVFKPVLEKLDYEVIRADSENSPGSISRKIVERILKSDMIIADITDENPNVFYELAIRNSISKPVIIIKAPQQKPPFDIQDTRCISVDMSIPDIWQSSLIQLEIQIRNAQDASISILSDFTKSVQLDAEHEISPQTKMFLQIKDMAKVIQSVDKKINTSKSFKSNSNNKTNAEIRTDKGNYTDSDEMIIISLWTFIGYDSNSVYTYRINRIGAKPIFSQEMTEYDNDLNDDSDDSATCPILTLKKKYGTYQATLFKNGVDIAHVYFNYKEK